MFQVLDKKGKYITIKMDIDFYNGLKSDIVEDFSQYEFVFDKPIKAAELLNNSGNEIAAVDTRGQIYKSLR